MKLSNVLNRDEKTFILKPKNAYQHMVMAILDFQRLKTNRKGCRRMHCVTKKSMDDEGVRFQIINLLKSAGTSSSDSDLNNAEVHNESSLFIDDANARESNARRFIIENDFWMESSFCKKIHSTALGLSLPLRLSELTRMRDAMARFGGGVSAMKSSLRKNLEKKNTTDLLDGTLEGK